MLEERSRILLRWDPKFVREGDGRIVNDYSVGIRMVEQLVVAGATEVVSDNAIFSSVAAKDWISPLFKNRFRVIDSKKSFELSDAVLHPVLCEFGFEGSRGLLRPMIARSETNSDIRFVPSPTELDLLRLSETACSPEETQTLIDAAVANLHFSLPDFLLACEAQLGLDFDLSGVKVSIAVLLLNARDKDTRAALATLAGLFNSYRPNTVPSLELRSALDRETHEQIAEFLEASRYRRLSEAGWRIGIPAHLNRALLLAGGYARSIANSVKFKPLFNLTAKMITAATQMPVPDSELASAILRQRYMPPVIQLADLRKRALAAHQRLAGTPLTYDLNLDN